MPLPWRLFIPYFLSCAACALTLSVGTSTSLLYNLNTTTFLVCSLSSHHHPTSCSIFVLYHPPRTHLQRSDGLKKSLHGKMTPLLSPEGRLFCLHDPTKKTKGKIVDIIAVHGFHLVTEKPWTAPDHGTAWLSYLLTKDYPDARVLTYSYEVKAVFTGNWEVFESAVADLISQIASARQQILPTRPLVFVCHELGGLLVEAVSNL